MLTISPAASEAIKNLIAASDLPEDAGIRISNTPDDSGRLGLAVVPQAADADQVVEDEGALVFLEAEVAGQLEDKMLDLQSHGDEIVFMIVDGRTPP